MEKQVENVYVVIEGGKFITKTETISSQAAPGHVLVKVAYSTCNPYDTLCFQLQKQEGFRLGAEGCGTVISVGEGADQSLLGKKVANFLGGWWAKYISFDTKKSHFMVFDDSQDLTKCGAACINPLTTIGMVQAVRDHSDSKAFIADAAASSLNKQILLKIKADGDLKCINIVRREEHAKFLKEVYGQEHVLLEGSPTFKEDIKSLIDQLKPHIFFDVVGGGSPVVVPVFQALPYGGRMVVVANLTHTPVLIDTIDILLNNKSIAPYLCFPWLESLTPEKRVAVYKEVADDLGKNEGRVYGTNFTKQLPLTSWEEALKTHAEVASKEFGKILLVCNP